MRALTIIAVCGVLGAAAGCGGGDGEKRGSAPLPPVRISHGEASYEVESQAEADALCERVQENPPPELRGKESVLMLKGIENLTQCVLKKDRLNLARMRLVTGAQTFQRLEASWKRQTATPPSRIRASSGRRASTAAK